MSRSIVDPKKIFPSCDDMPVIASLKRSTPSWSSFASALCSRCNPKPCSAVTRQRSEQASSQNVPFWIGVKQVDVDQAFSMICMADASVESTLDIISCCRT